MSEGPHELNKAYLYRHPLVVVVLVFPADALHWCVPAAVFLWETHSFPTQEKVLAKPNR